MSSCSHSLKNRGKTAVLNDVVPRLGGDVLILSDANTHMAPDAARRLAEWFADPTVGVVCGRLVLLDRPAGPGQKRGRSGTWKYETFLKEMREPPRSRHSGSNGSNLRNSRPSYSRRCRQRH